MRNIKLLHLQVPLEDSLKDTLKVMRYLEHIALLDFEFRQWIENKFKNNCGVCLLKHVWQYVQNNFTYREDFFDEVIINPIHLLSIRAGDCDDFSLFIHTILIAMGLSPRYILLGAEKGKYTHVAVFCLGTYVDGANVNFNIIPPKYRFYDFV